MVRLTARHNGQSSNSQSPNALLLKKCWWLKSILLPFAVTRGLLILAGYLAPLFLPLSYNPDPAAAARGWIFTPYRLLDMWFRWDAGWYSTIIKEGYRMVEDVYTTSNLAFFPVYPLLVKLLLAPFPQEMITDSLMIAMGVILSNLMLLGALVLLYKLTLLIFKPAGNNAQIAQIAVWLLLVFPSNFFLSSFYTESSFLFFSLLSLYLAKKGKWGWASLAAAVTGATRVVGIMIALPLLWEYLDSIDWKLKNLKGSVLWLGLVPLGVLMFFSYLYYLTGDFLAAVKVQSAWGRRTSNPLRSFLSPAAYWPLVTEVDQAAILGVIASSLGMLAHRLEELLPLGIYSLLLIIPTLFTGTLDSATRFAAVIFPMFMYGGCLLIQWDKKWLNRLLLAVLMILQLVLFARYSQFYWAG
jgi:hypothetical protein